MTSDKSIKNSLIIFAVLFFALVSFAGPSHDYDYVAKILTDRTNGNNAFYNKALAPAQSLELDKNKSDRVKAANAQIVREVTSVVSAFKKSAENKKQDFVSQAINAIDSDIVKNGGANISFVDKNPSAAYARTYLMIPKKLSKAVTAGRIFDILTSYKRSAKPSDHLYEYASAQNLTQGNVRYVQGNDQNWKGAEAAKPFAFDKDFVLKKCRQLLGWRCVTSLYHADTVLKSTEAAKILFISIYDLTANPDNAEFAGDKRSINQVTGSTAIYAVKESTDWVLVYGIDSQWNDGKLSFQGSIQNEFKKDFDRFKERISDDLKISL